MSEQETNDFIDHITKAFVKQKLESLNTLSQIYLYLNNTFVELIMFKNSEDNIQNLFESHSRGNTETPTELEEILEDEAKFYIKKLYDNKRGAAELFNIEKKFRNKGGQINLLDMTKDDSGVGITKKIKLR